MPKQSASSGHARRRDRTDASGRRPRNLSDQARVALTLVVVFAVAFVSVIGLKIYQEWRDLKGAAELSQARSAAFLAERSLSRLVRAQGAAAGTAASLEATGGDAPAVVLASLAADSLILEAVLVSDAGELIAASQPDAADDLVQAAAATDPIWAAAVEDGPPRLFAAAALTLPRGGARVVIEIDPALATPSVGDSQVFALIDQAGRVVAANGAAGALARGASAAEAFGLDPLRIDAVRSGAGGAISDARIPGPTPGVLGVAPVPGTELTVLLAGPLVIDEQLWNSTRLFYMLLLVAPILVAIGLCAVLLMQMRNIQHARELLEDHERRFRLAIEGARCGVWDWDLANDTVFITDSLARMFGRDAAMTMKGSEFLALVREHHQELVAEAIRSAPDTGEVDVEFQAYSRPVWLHARGRPWSSGRVVGVAIDVSEQKGAQARVTAAESRLRAALESVSECFVLWDARRRLVLSNRKYREFFNLDAKLVTTSAAYEMLELAAQQAIKAVHPSVEEGARELELRDSRWIHFSERRTNDGGLVSIGTDITALKKQEALLVQREKELQEKVASLKESSERIAEYARRWEQEKIRAEEASRAKSEFLANMSHELRTPLNAINGFSDVMVQEMFGPLGDARYKEYAKDILTSGQLLLSLINDILDMARIEAGRLKLSLETVSPNELAEQCARFVRGKSRDADQELVIDVVELPPVIADPRAVKQVLLNLLTNAIKFTPEGGRVVMEGRATADGVRFRVIDTGIGIAAADLRRLGRPFEQIESQQSKSHQGSGLGLALSRSLVELHGGTLTIESELGKGTTVTVDLPLDAEAAARAKNDAAERDVPTLEPVDG